MTIAWRFRAAVLALAGVLAVHHGRYLFASPAHEHELAGAHTYLAWLTPVAGGLLFLVVAQLAGALARLQHEGAPRLPSARSLWFAATATLISVFLAQECLETVLVHGRLPELAEILSAGGWTALPFAGAAAAVIALLLRGAAAAVRWALSRHERRTPAPVRLVAAPRSPVLVPRGSLLARRLAGRAPPALS